MSRNTVLKFYANWCGPCQTYIPILDTVFYSRRDISLRSINVDQDPMAAFEYGVSTIPTLILLQDDKVVGRIDGVQSAPSLKAKLTEVFGEPVT